MKVISAFSWEVVVKGQPIGIVGGDPGDPGRGSSTGAHCHWWATRDGVRVRPEDLDWEGDVDKAKLEDALNRLWDIRNAFEAGSSYSPEFAALSQKLFDIIVDAKVAAGLQD